MAWRMVPELSRMTGRVSRGPANRPSLPRGGWVRAKLTVLFGRLRLLRLALAGAGQVELPCIRTMGAGKSITLDVPTKG